MFFMIPSLQGFFILFMLIEKKSSISLQVSGEISSIAQYLTLNSVTLIINMLFA